MRESRCWCACDCEDVDECARIENYLMESMFRLAGSIFQD